MQGTVSYGALGPRERSIIDALAAGDVWSPAYYGTWLRDRAEAGRKAIRLAFADDNRVSATETEATTSIPADFIRDLLFGKVTDNQGHPITVNERGAHMRNAAVTGELDLTALEFRRPISFEDCSFDRPIVLVDAKLGRVLLNNSALPILFADRCEVEGAFSFEKVRGCKTVQLHSARIRGALTLSWTKLDGDETDERHRTLNCSDARIDGNVFLTGFAAMGEVRFVGATIGANLFCDDAEFASTNGSRAVYCNNAAIGASVFLRNARATGEINFVHAKIGGRFSCKGGNFRNDRGISLNCDSITIQGGVSLKGKKEKSPFCAKGGVHFRHAKVGGSFDCTDGHFDSNNQPLALDCNATTIAADVLLRGDFSARGGVDFGGAVVGGWFNCTGGKFVGEIGNALNCGAMTVGASVNLNDNFEAKGGVNFDRSKVKGNFRCRHGSFAASGELNALHLHGAHVDATLYLTKVKSFEGTLDLQDAYVRDFADDASVWKPKKGSKKKVVICLDGFEYDSFSNDEDTAPTDISSKFLLAWLKTQPKGWCDKEFRPQPFTQCAKVLRSMGYIKDSRLILYEREKRRLRHHNVTRAGWLVRAFFLGPFAGYGYRAHRAFVALLGIWCLGVVIFAHEGRFGLMRVASDPVLASNWYVAHHTKPPDYEPFKPLLYSLDVLLPIIDFNQKHSWIPNDADEHVPGFERILPTTPDANWAHWLRGFLAWLPKVYYWLEIIMGWFLSTVIIAGLAGLLGNPREE